MENEITVDEALALTKWFVRNQRDLPWRNTGRPYDVWISEIMLQQTRVEAVKQRFILFRDELPDIESLAAVDDDRLMKLWEGMGYYSRARNLKKCAQVLVKEYDGRLPDDPDVLRKLPGIGPYTAGAIASLAYGKAVPAVDGNVLRVLSRLWGSEKDIRDADTKKQMEQIIRSFYESNIEKLKKKDADFVSHFNQGLMELGAIVCLPDGKPLCEKCPWKNCCIAFRNHSADRIPYRSPLKKRKIIKRTLLVIRDGDRFLLHKRDMHGLLAGLYEWIGVDSWLKMDEAASQVEKLGFHALHIKRLPDSKHVFTHLEWHMHAYEIMVADVQNLKDDSMILVTKKELADFAVPSAFKAVKDYYLLND